MADLRQASEGVLENIIGGGAGWYGVHPPFPPVGPFESRSMGCWEGCCGGVGATVADPVWGAALNPVSSGLLRPKSAFQIFDNSYPVPTYSVGRKERESHSINLSSYNLHSYLYHLLSLSICSSPVFPNPSRHTVPRSRHNSSVEA